MNTVKENPANAIKDAMTEKTNLCKHNDGTGYCKLTGDCCVLWYGKGICLCEDEDVVLVVRCKDCKYSSLPSALTQLYGVPGTLTCKHTGTPCNKRNVGRDDFCSYGERKEG